MERFVSAIPRRVGAVENADDHLQIHIKSADPYEDPFFDSGFMNNKADFAPIRWSYKKTREVARRMDGKSVLMHWSLSFDWCPTSLPR